MGAGGVALQIVGKGASMMGQAASIDARYDTRISNAALLNLNADLVDASAKEAGFLMGKSARKLKAKQKSQLMAMGGGQGGTSLLVMMEQAREMHEGMQDVQRDKLIESQGLRYNAKMEEALGKLEQSAGYFGMFGSLISGVGSMTGKG